MVAFPVLSAADKPRSCSPCWTCSCMQDCAGAAAEQLCRAPATKRHDCVLYTHAYVVRFAPEYHTPDTAYANALSNLVLAPVPLRRYNHHAYGCIEIILHGHPCCIYDTSCHISLRRLHSTRTRSRSRLGKSAADVQSNQTGSMRTTCAACCCFHEAQPAVSPPTARFVLF